MKNLSLLLFLCALSFTACKFDIKTNDNDDDDRTERPEDKDNPLSVLQKTVEDISNGKKSETVDYEVLEELLTERLAGYRRDEDVEAAKTGMLGMSISTASTTYRDGDDKIDVTIVDTGNMGIAAAMASWAQLEFDKKDKNGFERTSEMDGHKTFEHFDKKGNSEFAMLYLDRYLVTASGRVKDFDHLKNLIRKMKLRKLPEA